MSAVNQLPAGRCKNARPSSAYETRYGRMFQGFAEELLTRDPVTRRQGKVQLIFTSPPFPLNTKKRYGNRNGQEYVEWLCSFGPIFRDYLVDDGSLVIELGNAW